MQLSNFTPPTTPAEQTAFNDGLLAHYHEGRDKPAPYIAPPPAPSATPDVKPVAIVTAKVGAVAVIATGTAAACVGIWHGVTAFAALYAAEVGAVCAVVFVAALVVGGLSKGEHEPNVKATSVNEPKQTTINIHVNAAGGDVKVN